MSFVKSEKFGQIDIGDAIAIGEKKRLVVGQIVSNPLDAAARHCGVSRFNERDSPIFGATPVIVDGAIDDVYSHVAEMQTIIEKIFFDNVTLVAKTNHEIRDAMRRKNLHDMPQNRPSSDLDHRLWLRIRLFRESRTKSPCQNHSFRHRWIPRPLCSLRRTGENCRPSLFNWT